MLLFKSHHCTCYSPLQNHVDCLDWCINSFSLCFFTLLYWELDFSLMPSFMQDHNLQPYKSRTGSSYKYYTFEFLSYHSYLHTFSIYFIHLFLSLDNIIVWILHNLFTLFLKNTCLLLPCFVNYEQSWFAHKCCWAIFLIFVFL